MNPGRPAQDATQKESTYLRFVQPKQAGPTGLPLPDRLKACPAPGPKARPPEAPPTLRPGAARPQRCALRSVGMRPCTRRRQLAAHLFALRGHRPALCAGGSCTAAARPFQASRRALRGKGCAIAQKSSQCKGKPKGPYRPLHWLLFRAGAFFRGWCSGAAAAPVRWWAAGPLRPAPLIAKHAFACLAAAQHSGPGALRVAPSQAPGFAAPNKRAASGLRPATIPTRRARGAAA